MNKKADYVSSAMLHFSVSPFAFHWRSCRRSREIPQSQFPVVQCAGRPRSTRWAFLEPQAASSDFDARNASLSSKKTLVSVSEEKRIFTNHSRIPALPDLSVPSKNKPVPFVFLGIGPAGWQFHRAACSDPRSRKQRPGAESLSWWHSRSSCLLQCPAQRNWNRRICHLWLKKLDVRKRFFTYFRIHKIPSVHN